MKYLIRIVSIIGLFSIPQFVYPAPITDTYTTGETLTATKLNNTNSAVNSNDARITTNATGITTNAAGIATNATGITTNDARIMTLEVTYAIGDTGPAGGWVFYVDVNGQHGLEAALIDRNTSIRWDNGAVPSTRTEARGDGVGAGEMNTMLIIAEHGFDSNNYAAGFCANLVITNASVDYGDWYLPSKYELDLMYLNIGQGSALPVNVGGFANTNYWSSSEFSDIKANLQDFSTGFPGLGDKDGTSSVRAVRAF